MHALYPIEGKSVFCITLFLSLNILCSEDDYLGNDENMGVVLQQLNERVRNARLFHSLGSLNIMRVTRTSLRRKDSMQGRGCGKRGGHRDINDSCFLGRSWWT